MMMLRMLAIVGVTGLASCTGDSPAELSPAQSATPSFGAISGEAETPNSLPENFTNRYHSTSETDVVGVTHLPP